MVRHDFHWLKEGEAEAPTVRGIGMRLSKLKVSGEEEGDLAEGEVSI